MRGWDGVNVQQIGRWGCSDGVVGGFSGLWWNLRLLNMSISV